MSYEEQISSRLSRLVLDDDVTMQDILEQSAVSTENFLNADQDSNIVDRDDVLIEDAEHPGSDSVSITSPSKGDAAKSDDDVSMMDIDEGNNLIETLDAADVKEVAGNGSSVADLDEDFDEADNQKWLCPVCAELEQEILTLHTQQPVNEFELIYVRQKLMKHYKEHGY